MQNMAAFRHHMIDGQLEPSGVVSERVKAAMGVVPREWFVPEGLAACAYADESLPLDAQRHMLSPLLLGQLLEVLDAQAGHNVLCVGSGTGYGAAVLFHLGCKVHMLESSTDLANKARQILSKHHMGSIEVHMGSLQLGYAAAAPYDRILVEGAVHACAAGWRDQLKAEGGMLAYVVIDNELPFSHRGLGSIRTLRRAKGSEFETTHMGVNAPLLAGSEKKARFDFD